MTTQAVHMVLGQVYTNKVQNPRLLEALTSTPREQFVPPAFSKSAYVDAPLPYGSGRFMLEPLIVAEMISHAQLSSTSNVLIIGAGLGYTVALASKLASMVVGIEVDPSLANSARVLLAPYAPKGRIELVDNLAKGYDRHAPYDAIIIEGAIEHLPTKLTDQLATNGRLVAITPLGVASAGTCGLGRVTLYTLTEEGLTSKEIADCAAARLADFESPASFSL